jgi:hypothetical protein
VAALAGPSSAARVSRSNCCWVCERDVVGPGRALRRRQFREAFDGQGLSGLVLADHRGVDETRRDQGQRRDTRQHRQASKSSAINDYTNGRDTRLVFLGHFLPHRFYLRISLANTGQDRSWPLERPRSFDGLPDAIAPSPV